MPNASDAADEDARRAEALAAGAVDSLPAGALAEKLTAARRDARPLRVKLGIDPTAPRDVQVTQARQTLATMIDAAKAEVLKKNHLSDAYVRPIAWRGSEMMGVAAQRNTIHLGIAVWEWPSYFDPAQRMKGIRLDIADYRRPDPATAPAMAKAAGLYMICTISKHRAERCGYADALMFDWQGRVAECTGANIFFVKNGTIHTPIADCFLAGITRATVIDLARKRGFEVIERRILPAELGEFDECFITGTAAEVTPVGEIGPHSYKPAAVTAALIDAYSEEVKPRTKAA